MMNSYSFFGRRAGRLMILALLTLALPVVAVNAAGLDPADLTLDDRLSCQAAIETVYWDHRLWPAENPDPKPAYDEVVSQEDVRAKVEDTLRRSNALAGVWSQEITGTMLQAEIERMAVQTQQPEILAELW
jgi:hypothetical protein